jgi:hypothetical protein
MHNIRCNRKARPSNHLRQRNVRPFIDPNGERKPMMLVVGEDENTPEAPQKVVHGAGRQGYLRQL